MIYYVQLCILYPIQWAPTFVFCFLPEKKQNYSGTNKILIDDRPDNIEQWRSKGGIGILHTNTADTLKQLQNIGL